MTNEKGIQRHSSGGVTAHSTMQSPEEFIKLLEQAEKIAEYVIHSETFGRAFEQDVEVTDEKGNVVLDNKGNPITKKIKNKADVVAAVLLGSDLGIPPMAAITLGKRLNADAYFKVMKGKSLGLDPTSALNSISIINTQAGPTTHTGVHVIAKCMIDAGVKFKIIEDFTPIYKYYNIDGNSEIDYEKFKSKIYLIEKESTKEELKQAKEEGKILSYRKLYTRRTTITFNRKGFEELVISYTLQDATDAGLYKGKTTDGEVEDGKANWNNHPATMLRNRVLTIGGRIIAADRLQGIYSNEEASEFTNYTLHDNDIKDVSGYAEDVTPIEE